MPLVQISVPAGALTQEQKQEMISRVTDVVVEVERLPAIRPGVWVQINEVPEGGWGIGGKAYTRADLAALLRPVTDGAPAART